MRHSLRTGREELTALRFAILGGDFCTAAAAGNLNTSDCLPDRDFHSFAGKHRIGEPFLTQFFDALKKLVVVVRVVTREGQALRPGHLLTTDGHRPYLEAVQDTFGEEIDFAMLQKIYGKAEEGPETRYSPAVCMGARKTVISGTPDHNHISTSYVERQNLTMRMSMRRFTRLTNAFSKKLENLEHAVALHYMHYNFCRIHQSLRVTPAMEAGVDDHVWDIDELIALI